MRVIADVLEVYFIVLFVRVILTWFPIDPSTFIGKVAHVLQQVTEPLLAPIRKILPPVRIGSSALDISPLVVLVLLSIVISILGGSSFGGGI